MARWLKRFFASLRRCGKTHGMEPTESDLEQVVDAARKASGLGPAPRSPEQGVTDMEDRIRELTELKRKLLDQEVSDKEITEINQQLSEAKNRLAEYQAQIKGQN